jgi:hypothetical protein
LILAGAGDWLPYLWTVVSRSRADQYRVLIMQTLLVFVWGVLSKDRNLMMGYLSFSPPIRPELAVNEV